MIIDNEAENSQPINAINKTAYTTASVELGATSEGLLADSAACVVAIAELNNATTAATKAV